MYSILVVGAGYTGSRIAAHFSAKKQKVSAIVKTETRKPLLESAGVQTFTMDLTRPEAIQKFPPAHFIVISLAPYERSPEAYRETYVRAVGNFLEALKKNPKPFLIVYLSSTGVYRDRKGERVDENTHPEPDTERGKILLEAEEQVLRSGFPSIIFRLSGIYGPERNWIEKIRGGKALSPEENRIVNIIHVEDVVNALPLIFNRGEAGQVYLGVDDHPVERVDFCAWLRERLNVPVPADERKDSEGARGNRYSNEKLKTLGFQFGYPDFRKGYEALIQTQI